MLSIGYVVNACRYYCWRECLSCAGRHRRHRPRRSSSPARDASRLLPFTAPPWTRRHAGVAQVLRSGWIQRTAVQAFEQAFPLLRRQAGRAMTPHRDAGSALALRRQAGDEVITTPLTWSPTQRHRAPVPRRSRGLDRRRATLTSIWSRGHHPAPRLLRGSRRLPVDRDGCTASPAPRLRVIEDAASPWARLGDAHGSCGDLVCSASRQQNIRRRSGFSCSARRRRAVRALRLQGVCAMPTAAWIDRVRRKFNLTDIAARIASAVAAARRIQRARREWRGTTACSTGQRSARLRPAAADSRRQWHISDHAAWTPRSFARDSSAMGSAARRRRALPGAALFSATGTSASAKDNSRAERIGREIVTLPVRR